MDNSKIQLDAQPVLVYNFNKHLLVFLKPFSAGTELFFFFFQIPYFVWKYDSTSRLRNLGDFRSRNRLEPRSISFVLIFLSVIHALS